MPAGRQLMWYVKTGFGVELGPMSSDTLRQMADSGSLVLDDLARSHLHEEWQTLAVALDRIHSRNDANDDAPAEFDSEANDQQELEADAEFAYESSSVTETLVTEVAESTDTPQQRPRSSLPGWSNYWGADAPKEQTRVSLSQVKFSHPESSASVTLDVDEASVSDHESNPVADDSVTASPTERIETVTTHSENSFAQLETWKRERQERLDRLLKVVADREAAAARAAELAKAEADAEAAKLAADVEPKQGLPEPSTSDRLTKPSRTKDGRSSADITAAASPSTPKLSIKAEAADEAWEQTLARWRKSLPDWKVAVTVLVLPIALWFCWPVSYGNVAETYRTMFEELRAHRDRPQDKSGMTEFVERSQAKLDEIIPWLKNRSSSKDPDTRLLLWIGRDCLRPMLKRPKARDSREETMFKKLMNQWDHAHNSSSATFEVPEKIPTSAAPTSEQNSDPKTNSDQDESTTSDTNSANQ